jgi:hypothetical protein
VSTLVVFDIERSESRRTMTRQVHRQTTKQKKQTINGKNRRVPDVYLSKTSKKSRSAEQRQDAQQVNCKGNILTNRDEPMMLVIDMCKLSSFETIR